MRAVRLGSLIAAACLFSLPLAATPAHAVTRVYLLRGLADVSVGLDDLAAKLRRHGYPAVVASHTDASAVAARVLSEHKPGDAIIVIGHSLGADASLDVAQTVAAKGRRVELLVAFSPATTGEVPANVGRAINYYQSNSFWNHVWKPGSGFRGQLRNVDLAGNADVHHFNIEKLPSLHNAIIGFARGVTGQPAPGQAPGAEIAKR